MKDDYNPYLYGSYEDVFKPKPYLDKTRKGGWWVNYGKPKGKEWFPDRESAERALRANDIYDLRLDYKQPTFKNFKEGDYVEHVESGRQYVVVPKEQLSYTYNGYCEQTPCRPIEDSTGGWMVSTKNLVLIEKEQLMNTLYEVKVVATDGQTNTIFATKLAVNSSGQWVMEDKSNGNVFTASKDNIEEVMPYTVDIVFMGGSTTYSYLSEKGKFAADDLILMPSTASTHTQFAYVVAVDTKSKKATKELKPIGRVSVDKFE